MGHHRNFKIVPTLGLWLLLLCGVVGCASTKNAATCDQAIGCDGAYGFRATQWHVWPGYCATCPSQPTADQPADWEVVPTPQEESNTAGQQPIWRLPAVLQEDVPGVRHLENQGVDPVHAATADVE
jgi:hypothetical protein